MLLDRVIGKPTTEIEMKADLKADFDMSEVMKWKRRY